MVGAGSRVVLGVVAAVALGVVAAPPPAPNATGTCISGAASRPGPPDRLAYGEPDPNLHFPFVVGEDPGEKCTLPPGVRPPA